MITLKLKDDTGIVLNKTSVVPTKDGTYTYRFVGNVEVPNKQGWYTGVMVAYDEAHPSDKDTIEAP